MPVSPGFKTFVLEQLEACTRDLTARAMFGGVGLYAGERFFALIADDVLYFKVDDRTRGGFRQLGMRPFQPYGADGEAMGYYEVPIAALEDAAELRRWVADAIAVAERAANGRKAARPRRRR